MHIFRILSALLILTLPVTTPVYSEDTSTPDKKTIILTNAYDWVPFSYLNEDGKPTGAIVDYWQLWGRKNNIRVEFVLTPWSKTFELINEGKADIHSGLIYTEKRDESLDFSVPFMGLNSGIFVRKGLPVDHVKELKQYTVGVVQKDFAEGYIRDNYPFLQLRVFNDVVEIKKAAKDGQIDALPLNYSGSDEVIQAPYPELEDFILLEPLYSKELCAAVKEGNQKFLDLVNNGIKNISKANVNEIRPKWEEWIITISNREAIIYISVFFVSIILFLGISIWFLKNRLERQTATLKEREKRYYDLYDNAPDMYVSVDAKTTKIVECNQTLLEVTGYSKEEIIDRSVFDLYTPESAEHAKTNVFPVFVKTGVIEGEELQIQKKDGSIIDVLLNAKPVYDEQGNLLRSRSSWRDITDRKKIERVLHEYQKAIECSEDLIAAIDRNYKYLFVNEAFLKYRSMDRDQVIGRSVAEVLGQDVFEETIQPHIDRCLHGELVNYEMSLQYLDLGKRYLEVSYYPLKTGNEISGAVAVIKDITERKQAEEALAQSEAKNRAILDAIPDAIFQCTREGVFIDFKPGQNFEPLVPPEEFIGKKISDILPTEIASRIMDSFEQLFQTNQPQTVEYQLLFSEKLAYFEARLAICGSTEVVAVIHDITDRKQMEKTLREQEELYRTLFEQAADSIVLVDSETGTLVKFNDRTHENLGYTREEFQKLKIPDFEIRESAEEVAKHIEKICREGRDVFETKHHKKTGEIRNVLVSSKAISIGGKIFIQSIWSDITEHKQAEEKILLLNRQLERNIEDLERSNKDLEQFAYVASHDLQAPLRSLINNAQFLKQDYKDHLDEEGNEYIADIVDASGRMHNLIMDLLDYSRVGTSKQDMSLVDCTSIVNTIIDDLEIETDKGEFSITFENLPQLNGDKIQLTRVFQNIIQNSIKYRSQEPPNIHISAKQCKEEWVFSVKDNGIGIDPEYFERIFVIFQRLHTRSEYSGTGIGLAICKKIIERHHGKIWVESQPGTGSTFYFTIPMSEEESNAI